MKDKLTHEVEILGRSVSVLLLAGLIMAAGASAALLDSFGTVTGDAEVEQAIVVNNDGETTIGQIFDGENIVAGDTVVTERFTLQNNMDSAYTVSFDTTADGEDYQGTQFEWASGAIDTKYVNTFQDAGHDFADYEDFKPDSEDRTSGVYFIEDESDFTDEFSDYEVNEDGAEIYADSRGGVTLNDGVKIDADNVVFAGFDLEVDGVDGVRDRGTDTVVAYNRIVNTNYEGDNSYEAWSQGNAIHDIVDGSNAEYHNNYMEGFQVGTYANNQLDSFEYNTVKGVRNGITVAGGSEQAVNYNVFEGVHRGISHTDGSPVTATGNRFSLGDFWNEEGSRHISENSGNPDVEANNNYFANPADIQVRDETNIDSGDVTVSFDTGVNELDSGEEVEVEPIHEFGLWTQEADYSLTTTIGGRE